MTNLKISFARYLSATVSTGLDASLTIIWLPRGKNTVSCALITQTSIEPCSWQSYKMGRTCTSLHFLSSVPSVTMGCSAISFPPIVQADLQILASHQQWAQSVLPKRKNLSPILMIFEENFSLSLDFILSKSSVKVKKCIFWKHFIKKSWWWWWGNIL